MNRITIYELDLNYEKEKKVLINGWVRTNRDQKEFGFIMINDGTSFNSIQVVYEKSLINFDEIINIKSGDSIEVVGDIVLCNNQKQKYEIKAKSIKVLFKASDDYPIQPKRHTREFLRENAHFRSRTNLFNAVFRIRSKAAFLVHKFFNERNFLYVHTPLITAIDGEGAGAMFQVTTLNMDKEKQPIDYSKDFFQKKATLTVTGQLEAEAFAMSFSNVYTFGPTFRAENSNTTKHASEFWMIEPEMAFCDLKDDMNIMESLIKYVIKNIMNECPNEFEFFEQFVEKGLIERLNNVLNSNWPKITHHEAIDILINSKEKFENKPIQGHDLASEHEKYLTDVYFKSPVFITDWPKDIKAFYMRLNDDGKTVAAVDLLVPLSGELCGGSQREERINLLVERMRAFGISEKDMDWYLDTRRFGGCIHSGFGMGFERLIMFLTGVNNIRDVIPFPRTPRNIKF